MNKRDTDLLDMLPALEDGSLMYTPISICRDMVNLIPDDVFNKDAKFLDIACKSGRFLREIMYRLMESNQMQSGSAEGRDKKKYNLAIESERKEYILREQLFGLSLNDTVVNIARRNLYGTLDSGIDNIIVLKENVRRTLKEKFGDMQFDVVVGNPPYNNDLYLDFVTFGHNLARKYDCWITPAKWQVKGGQKNEDFREDIVPYMSKIVYYPNTTEIFDIALSGGVTYFCADKSLHNKKDICVRKNGEIISKKNKEFVGTLDLTDVEDSILNKIRGLGETTVDKSDNDKFILKMSYICIKYNGTTHTNIGVLHNIEKQGTGIYFKDSKYYIEIDPLYLTRPKEIGKWHLVTSVWLNNTIGTLKLGVNEVSTDNNVTIYSTSDKNEIESVESYFNCKLIWWLIYRMHVGGNVNLKAFEFVPDPGAFDHIFTDEELYKKYNLSEDEINIIESIIKNRK